MFRVEFLVTVFEMSVMIINALVLRFLVSVFRKTGKWESRSARGSTNMGAHFTALYICNVKIIKKMQKRKIIIGIK